MRFFRLLMQIIILCFGLIFLISCGRNFNRQHLADIESILDSRPDSALALIRQIDTASLRGKTARAKFSLLHAAALDKNYIDTADTRIAQPAVDWYDRHGDPEERLKAWMYLGTEQFNGEMYNAAIVSFSKAIEDTSEIKDKNLLGLLYSRIAETYTRTREDNIAELFIDKSINCFLECDRRDQANKELIIKAKNLITLQKWERGDSLLIKLLKDSSITSLQRGRLEGIYAIAVLSSPLKDDILAYPHMLRALSLNGRLKISIMLMPICSPLSGSKKNQIPFLTSIVTRKATINIRIITGNIGSKRAEETMRPLIGLYGWQNKLMIQSPWQAWQDQPLTHKGFTWRTRQLKMSYKTKNSRVLSS